jgi:hypothetical protein
MSAIFGPVAITAPITLAVATLWKVLNPHPKKTKKKIKIEDVSTHPLNRSQLASEKHLEPLEIEEVMISASSAMHLRDVKERELLMELTLQDHMKTQLQHELVSISDQKRDIEAQKRKIDEEWNKIHQKQQQLQQKQQLQQQQSKQRKDSETQTTPKVELKKEQLHEEQHIKAAEPKTVSKEHLESKIETESKAEEKEVSKESSKLTGKQEVHKEPVEITREVVNRLQGMLND